MRRFHLTYNTNVYVCSCSEYGSEDDEDKTTPLIDESYWRKKGMILGRCVEMWDTFNQILDEGVGSNPEADENFLHTEL